MPRIKQSLPEVIADKAGIGGEQRTPRERGEHVEQVFTFACIIGSAIPKPWQAGAQMPQRSEPDARARRFLVVRQAATSTTTRAATLHTEFLLVGQRARHVNPRAINAKHDVAGDAMHFGKAALDVLLQGLNHGEQQRGRVSLEQFQERLIAHRFVLPVLPPRDSLLRDGQLAVA